MSTQPEYAELERRLAEVVNKHQYSDDGMCCSCGLGFDGEAWGYENHLVRMQLPIFTLFIEAKEAALKIEVRDAPHHVDCDFSYSRGSCTCDERIGAGLQLALATALQNWKEGAR